MYFTRLFPVLVLILSVSGYHSKIWINPMSNFKESTGDTIGGFGSTIALKRGSFKASRRKFMGTIVARPDIKNSLCTTSSILFLFKSIVQKERRVCLLFVL